jgi:hypothetical protein
MSRKRIRALKRRLRDRTDLIATRYPDGQLVRYPAWEIPYRVEGMRTIGVRLRVLERL